ncbi:MAG: ABC transporter ATP-binding protein, partial [Chloroflexi bacterium]|nr:ABC transporter ATP-binding protein [Chloroflexota bacterium]
MASDGRRMGPGGGPGGRMMGGARIEKARDIRGTARRLLAYLWPYKWGLAIVGLLVVASTLLTLVGPLL